jgi:hypothetical protein
MLTTFSASHNALIPFKKPWIKTQSAYQALWGKSTVSTTRFFKFGPNCNMKNQAIESNPMASDGQHPHMFKSITLDKESRRSLVKLHPPDEGWIVLDDCVSMDCDGPKHILLVDEDGSLLGSSNGGGNGGGSIIARAEHFSHSQNYASKWHKRRPKTLPNQMLVNPSDKNIPLIDADVVTQYGIVRTGCTEKTEWNAHSCPSTAALAHRMLVIESMDGDHETRSIVPLALAQNKVVDLMNGGQDHGWCFGYTCLKRLMAFNAIVSTGKEYHIYFGATNPQKIRLHLLNAGEGESIVVHFVYTNPQRLAVRTHDDLVVTDLNYEGNQHKSKGSAGNSYQDKSPTITSSHGTNAFQRATNTFSVTVRGAGTSHSSTQAYPLIIETLPIIQVSMTMAVDIENFYEGEFVNNIAFLLQIDKERVRVVAVVAGSVGVDLEIGPPLCEDAIISGNESDIDCGRDCSKKCVHGKKCNGHSDCESASCQSGTCLSPSCNDQILSPSLDETCVDGGGTTCTNKCADGKACVEGGDCESGRCHQGVCSKPTCIDTIKNQNEVDIDCGGNNDCPKCQAGASCFSGSHCTSDICLVEQGLGVCIKATCFDGKKNGNFETDRDCGGEQGGCPRCVAGDKCLSDSDCKSDKCLVSTTNVCAVATATDERKNNEESDQDCGGPLTPTRCRSGGTCLIDTDCESKNCNSAGVCEQNSCSDNIKNGDETDSDCGGSRCRRCSDEQTCSVGADCLNLFCRHYIVSTCKPADCSDSVLNGDETCIDGGGSCGAMCQDGDTCELDSDCINSKCERGTCVAASCRDLVFQSSSESDQDCGKTCAPCADTKRCTQNVDCISKHCQNNICQAPSCVDGIMNQGEHGIDCGSSSVCSLCGSGINCESDQDCQSSNCNGITKNCDDPSCMDGLRNGAEGCRDGGHTCQDKCLQGNTCNINEDCASLSCQDNICAAPSCRDNIVSRQLQETGTDCGGDICVTRCKDGISCKKGADCLSLSCGSSDNICKAASCADNIKNGDESGTDCGGSSCFARCQTGHACAINSDCSSGVCTNENICGAPLLAAVGGGATVGATDGQTLLYTSLMTQAKSGGLESFGVESLVVIPPPTPPPPSCSDLKRNGNESGVDW